MKRNKALYYIFIVGFVILYLATALISYCHAIEFFNIGNVRWMSMTLAAVFELGQMVVLTSILLSDNKKTVIPWMLLTILTAVQVIGNVFSVYKYMCVTESGDYVYLQQSLIDWWLAGVEQQTIMVIISWIIGALLPVIALFMTSMVSNNIKLMNAPQKEENKEDIVDDKPKETLVVEPKNEPISESLKEPIKEKKKVEKVEKKAPVEKKEVVEAPVNTNTVIYQPTKEKETIREIIKEVPVTREAPKKEEEKPAKRGPMSADTLSS